MMKRKTTYRWLCSCLITGGLLLTGCSNHYEEIRPVVEDSGLELCAVTRTDGAYTIPPTGSSSSPNIRLFLTTSVSSEKQEGGFQYESTEKRWKSNDLKVKEEAQYYMYGYMPDGIGGKTLTYLDGEGKTYADGAKLKLTALPAITDKDVCVIVGVQKVSNQSLTSTPVVTPGNYSYFSGIKGDNYVNLLMDHLYASIELSFKLDPTYAELRSIHLKTVTLNTSYGTVDATVELRARPSTVSASTTGVSEYGIGTPAFEKNSDADHTVAFLAATDEELVLNKNYTTTSLTLKTLAYCAPCTFSPDDTNLSLTTVYDVYDKDGHNLGERTSVNAINIASVPSGQKRKLTLTVNPTYLYVLSNWDIDNPVFVVE